MKIDNLKIRKFGLVIITLIIGLGLLFPSPAQAQTKVWSGVCVGGPNQDVPTIQGLQCLIANIFSIAITAIGFAGFVMLIIGAFNYLLSGGNSKGTETAKNTITYAVIGLVVALSAFIILNLIAEFTGVKTILNFTIPDSDTTGNTLTPNNPNLNTFTKAREGN